MKATDHQRGVSGVVFDIQRASLHDGPGLRTTVFLKGCPLRCVWCHNPESQRLEPETGRSGKIYGRRMTLAEVMHTVLADRAYYMATSGGITLSGGEPTVQMEFCLALLRAAREAGLHTCLDTSGHFPSRHLPALLPLVDLWHFDDKATGRSDHRRLTGVDGSLIQENLKSVVQAGARIRLRCPLVEGTNTSPEHMEHLRQCEGSGIFEAVERLPYHDFGNAKAVDLGRAVFCFTTDHCPGRSPHAENGPGKIGALPQPLLSSSK